MSTKHDFRGLLDKYPETIEKMPNNFTSHEFILILARDNQVAYIEALYDYRDSKHLGTPTPFQYVHSQLARFLNDFSHLAVKVRDDANSQDIFGTPNLCTEWKKVK